MLYLTYCPIESALIGRSEYFELSAVNRVLCCDLGELIYFWDTL